MTALAMNNNIPESSDKNVMSINANARIDYILKFSRHAVVVIDDLQHGFGSISGTFLASLPESANAALVSISDKLNDVQVRARINEQLFSGQPFDPEIALTQSVIEHYQTSNSPVAIVIEQAQHLSLQIIHELTLLAEIAKKSGRHIQVVLLGEIGLGKTIVDNYTLFNKKLSMISAHNGQLLTVNSEVFKTNSSFLVLTPFSKLILGLIIALVITAAGLYYLYQRDSLQFSQLPATQEVSEGIALETVASDSELLIKTEQRPKATADDVLLALNGGQVAEEQVKEYAAPSDILSAISSPGDGQTTAETSSQMNSETSTKTKTASTAITKGEINQVSKELPLETSSRTGKAVELTMNDGMAAGSDNSVIPEINAETTNSFANITTGVVIQYAALVINDDDLLAEVVAGFTERYMLTDYLYYNRLMNGQPFVVITSTIFQERKDAADAMLALPKELQNSGIWLKSVETIHKEMAVLASE